MNIVQVSGWSSFLLGQITENHDARRVPVKESERVSGPFPYYGASGIVDYVDKFLFDGEYLLIAEDGENLKTRKTPIAFLASGKYWVNNHAHIVRGNHLADTRFLNYALAMTDISGYLSGSTIPKLTQSNMNRIPVLLPPLPEQRRIAHILGTLDDKIELNRRMNETLEAMARALFKSWFVDFDPVRAKAEGRDTCLPADVAALFPDSFVDSEMGEIPAGWEQVTLGDVLSILETGSRPRGGVSGIANGVPSVGAESITKIGEFDYSKTKFVPVDYAQNMKRGHCEDGDVLLYKDGGRPGEFEPHITMIGRGFPFPHFCINEHVYRVRTDPQIPQSYTYFVLSSDSTMEEMRRRGTGVAIPGLNSTAAKSLPFLRPSQDLQDAFGRMVGPIIGKIFSNSLHSRTLSQLRDTLLPKLLSGELRVPAAEELVGD